MNHKINHKPRYGEGRGGSNQEQEYHMQRRRMVKGTKNEMTREKGMNLRQGSKHQSKHQSKQ